jgi:aspartyl-tRNA(Asn)/glutamyl-tRNA(Gln) amidotransferase subunit C
MNTQDIQKLAELARLAVTDEEAGALSQDMNAILGYIKQIENAQVTQTAKQIPITYNTMRPDTVADASGQVTEIIKDNFPHIKNNYLEVNKIISND